MCTSFNNQIHLIVRVIQGRFILVHSCTYRIFLIIETCNQVNKMGVETVSYQCRCILNDMIGLWSNPRVFRLYTTMT